jgi:hypothetical protein
MDDVIVAEVHDAHVEEQSHRAIHPTKGGARRLDIGQRSARGLYVEWTEQLLDGQRFVSSDRRC